MRTELERLLAEDLAWQARNEAEAEEARAAGDLARYHDLRVHERLPDTCWALGRWHDARRWYRHNAEARLGGREWHVRNSGPTYPIDELSDREAVALVKGGMLDAAGPALERALTYWRSEPASSLVLGELGLHAAQAGRADLAGDAALAREARKELSNDPERSELLAYEPAQVAVLLGRQDEARHELERLEEAERLEPILPDPLQDALLAALRGLRALVDGDPGDAQQAFEAAMERFYAFTGQLDANVYFMRLNWRMAADLADGRKPDPNPLADADGDP
jgi:hypothetical protein